MLYLNSNTFFSKVNKKYLDKMTNRGIIEVSSKDDWRDNMVNALLKGKIREKGMSQQDVASKIGVSLSRFNAKLNNTDGAQFTLREVKDMRVLLDLTPEQVDQIFFN